MLKSGTQSQLRPRFHIDDPEVSRQREIRMNFVFSRRAGRSMQNRKNCALYEGMNHALNCDCVPDFSIHNPTASPVLLSL
jgi:hypothetical protein